MVVHIWIQFKIRLLHLTVISNEVLHRAPLPDTCDLPKPDCILGDIFICEDDVLQDLTSLDPSKAMGCDGIGPKLLKHYALSPVHSKLLYHSPIWYPHYGHNYIRALGNRATIFTLSQLIFCGLVYYVLFCVLCMCYVFLCSFCIIIIILFQAVGFNAFRPSAQFHCSLPCIVFVNILTVLKVIIKIIQQLPTDFIELLQSPYSDNFKSCLDRKSVV